MKKSIITTIILALTASFTACTHDIYDEGYLNRTADNGHYVQYYRIADDFRLTTKPVDEGFDLVVVLLGERLSHTKSQDSLMFHTFAEFYKDTSYSKSVQSARNQVLAYPLKSIKIVADKDFNETYKSGEDLSAFAIFNATSPYEFIQSNYTDIPNSIDYHAFWQRCGFLGGDYNQPKNPFKPIEIPAQSVNEHNTHMLWNVFHLWFKEKPQSPGPYTFTVTVSWNDTTVSKQLTLTF